MTKYSKNDTRKIRIEPNPFKQIRQKFRMKSRRISGGQPVINLDGTPSFTEVTPESLYRVPGTSKKISPARNQNGLNTGLTQMVTNPYKDLDIYTAQWEVILKGKDKVSLQHALEYECGYPFDYLTHRIEQGAIQSDKPDKKFFETADSKPTLDGNVTFLDMTNSLHKIWYYLFLAHKEVANTWDDLLDGGNEDAGWYIVDEESKQKREKTKSMQAVEAGAALKELHDSTSDAILQMPKVLELAEASDRNMTKDKAFNILYNYYNKDSESFTAFIEGYTLWKDAAMGRERFIAMAELYDYIQQGLVTYKGGRYTWYKVTPGEPAETYTFNGKMTFVVEFLLSPANQDNVEKLQGDYENKIR
jgi:hypothetical protein